MEYWFLIWDSLRYEPRCHVARLCPTATQAHSLGQWPTPSTDRSLVFRQFETLSPGEAQAAVQALALVA
jgi:hypothetical protein